jgi:nitroreductase
MTGPAHDPAAIDEVIRRRRTHKSFGGNPVPRAVLDELLALAVQEPMHRLANPWRFCLLDQAAIAALGRWLPTQPQIVNDPDPDKGPRKLAKLIEHYFPQLGAMILVTWVRSADDLVDREDLAATSAAVQNILLGAEARGLATFWASSPAPRDPETRRCCGADPAAAGVAGALWLGDRHSDPPPPPRRPVAELTRIPSEA